MKVVCPVCGNQYDMPRIYALHLTIAHDGWNDSQATAKAIEDFNIPQDTVLIRRTENG